MVFLKNTATRVGHSIVWGSRYSPRFAKIFQQVSFWISKLVEKSFFSKKFKYASVMYSHVTINGFERFIFLTIFVYDGLLVSLLYSLYRLLVTSKFFRRFSFLFRRRPLSFPLPSSLNFSSPHTVLKRSHKKTKFTQFLPVDEVKPYYQTYYSRVSLFLSRLLPRKHIVFSWNFFKKRFSYFRLLQLQASKYFYFKSKPIRSPISFAQKVRSFLFLFFRNFFFFRKFKLLGFHILRQSSEFSNPGILFFNKKVFRRSFRYESYKTLLFSAFLHEFFSKMIFYASKISKTSSFKKSIHYTYFTIFFNRSPRPRSSFRLYRNRLLKSVKLQRRTAQLQGQVSFFPLLFFFQRYLRRLKRKYRFYMGNPTYFFSYSSIYLQRKFKYMSRRRRRRIFFQTRKSYKYYARRPGFRFGLKRFRRIIMRRKRLLKSANQRALKKLIQARAKMRLPAKAKSSVSQSSPVRKSSNSSKPSSTRTFKSLLDNVKLLKAASNKPRRHFSSFVNRFHEMLGERKHVDSPTSSLAFSSESVPNLKPSKKSSRASLSPFNHFDSTSRLPLRVRKFLFRKKLYRKLWYVSKRFPPSLRKEVRDIIRSSKYQQFALRRFKKQLRARTLRNRYFKRKSRRRIIRFDSFNFNNLLVGNLYKRILTLIFKRNMLGRRAFYSLFRVWFSLSFGRLFSFFVLIFRIVLIFPINLRSNILAKYITKKLEFHYSLNELIYPILKTLRPFFKGFHVRASGRFSRAQRASVRKFSFGKISFSTLGNSLSYVFRWTRLKYGVCSVKLWLLPKRNRFFRKNFYERQLDKNFRLILFDSFFNSYTHQILQHTLKKFKFFQRMLQNLMRIRVKNKLIHLLLESIKLAFYRFKQKVDQFVHYIYSKAISTIFIFYSFSFFNKNFHSFFFFDVLATRVITRYFYFRRKSFWFFSILMANRRKPEFMWSFASSDKPTKRFVRNFWRFRRAAYSNFIPLRYGTH